MSGVRGRREVQEGREICILITESYDQPRQHIKKQRGGGSKMWRNRMGRPLYPPQIH